MLRFSCSDYTFPVLERSAALRLIKLLDINHVDIGLFARSSHFSPTELQASPKNYTAQLLHVLDATELLVSDVFLQIGVHPSECAANDPSSVVREKNRDVFARALEFCVALGCDHLTGLPGVFHAEVSRDRDLELATKEAVRRVNECARAGVRYAIEAHLDSICEGVDGTQAFLNASEGLTLTLDYGHFITSGETSARVHSLLPFASHVHVRGGAIGRLQTSVDENTIDFPGMLAGLQELGYGGFLALEYVWVDWKGCNRTDNVSETLLLQRALESAASKITTARMNHV
jgi:sugar phosphate isomerase/epimerase